MGEKTEIEWSDANRRKAELVPGKEEIGLIREQWASLTNERLKELGHEVRIDHRSLEAQGIEREPTVHLGPAVSGMERRGIETEVGKRLELEALEAGQQRLEKAAELGRLERETAGLERSILDLSGDLEGAKRDRDQQLAKSQEKAQELSRPKPTIEQLQREGREAWLALRAEQKAAEIVMAQTPEQVVGLVVEQVIEKGAEKPLEPERKPKLSIDEEQAQARQRWLEYRQAQALGQSPGPQKGLEKGQEKDQGLERDGPELE